MVPATRGKVKEVVPLIDAKNDAEPPLDYSFKYIVNFDEVLDEEPRNVDTSAKLDAAWKRRKSVITALQTSRDAAKLAVAQTGAKPASVSPEDEEADEADRPLLPATALRLNNNQIESLVGASKALDSLLVDPKALAWLDISFNALTLIDAEVLQFPNLKVLYLHGNAIADMMEVDKLVDLPKLMSLTLHGNPIEELGNYHLYIISQITQLRNLDFSSVTKGNRKTASTWESMRGKEPFKLLSMKKQQEQQQLMRTQQSMSAKTKD